MVLFDANAFLPPLGGPNLTGAVDRWVPGAELRVPGSVRRELRHLVERGVPGAELAEALAARFPVEPNVGSGDEAIVRLARARKASVVTADRGLRARLLDAGVAVLYPRDRTRLVLLRSSSSSGVSATVKSPSKLAGHPRGRRKP
jgi:rRNA-processing protein FCF1